MNKHKIDLTLLRKMFEAKNMSDREISAIMGESNSTIRLHRIKMGFEKPLTIRCNVCGKDKKPCSFDKAAPGVCKKCQHLNGMRPVNGHGGRPAGNGDTINWKCLCGRNFEAKRAYKFTESSEIIYLDKPLNRLCPRCHKLSRYIGDLEADYASIRASVTINDMPVTARYRATAV